MASSTRRSFLKMGALAGSGLLLSGNIQDAFAESEAVKAAPPALTLLGLSHHLVKTWADKMLDLQIKQPGMSGLHGGILCPACSTIHGRCADTVFPFLYLASKTGDRKYITAAKDVYNWMEANVSMPDGAWVNEISTSDWKGITVFTAISLAETLEHYGNLLDKTTRNAWEERLKKAIEFVYEDFTINTGNINYPVTATYALALCGRYFKEPRYTEKARSLAHDALSRFTPNDTLLYGEGHPAHEPSETGCYSVDLGYNVEESLPALVMYAQLTDDDEVMQVVKKSLTAHAQFMLPDGAWDNSWGTRNFKWTWWGSRTSDGCQPAFALMAGYDPSFYTIALRNTQLMSACTSNGLLHGGPHYQTHGVLPCVHHSFGHSKALTVLLARQKEIAKLTPAVAVGLPRSVEYGVKHFKDINTWLVATSNWRATFTANDREYSMRSGHASGGALSLLWHPKAGAILCSSMSVYQLTESANMQRDKDDLSMPLTPRFELKAGKTLYTNVQDLNADVATKKEDDAIVFTTQAQLLSGDQQKPDNNVKCRGRYTFGKDQIDIEVSRSGGNGVKYYLPVIASTIEKVTIVSDRELHVQKAGGRVEVRSSVPFNLAPTHGGRVFNYVPGMEAVPLVFEQPEIRITIEVR